MTRKRKTRMISFRLTDEEFHQLQTLCETKGLRSVSELARLAISSVNLAGHDSPTNGSAERVLGQVNTRLAALEQTVRELIRGARSANAGASD